MDIRTQYNGYPLDDPEPKIVITMSITEAKHVLGGIHLPERASKEAVEFGYGAAQATQDHEDLMRGLHNLRGIARGD